MHGQSLEWMSKKVTSVKLWTTPNVLQKPISTFCVPNKNLAKHSFLVLNCYDCLFERVFKTTLDKQLLSIRFSFISTPFLLEIISTWIMWRPSIYNQQGC
jgi:hypothetical protein